MSDEHDRLLAQGPRVAPEPLLATDDGALVPVAAPAPQMAAAATTSADNPGRTPSAPVQGRSGRRARPSGLRRLIPVIFFAFVIVARSFGGNGRVEAALFGVAAVVVVTLILVRKARQL